MIGDLDDFDPSTGSEYLFIHEDQPVVSATQFMRQAWIDAGRPGVDEMVVEPSMARSASRACTPHAVGDNLNVNTAGGQISAYVAKTTTSVAFIVQSGRTLSSTVLNNLASTWDSTIYPTMTTYYGKDYFDGNGLAPPDVDNNCQVQIVIYDIDGAYNTGGYFAPPSQTHERLCLSILLTSPSHGENQFSPTNLNTSCTMHSTLTKTCGSMKATPAWRFTCALVQIPRSEGT